MKLRSFLHLSPVGYFIVDYSLLWAATVLAFKLSPKYVNEILIGPWLNQELRLIGYGMPAFMALGLQLAELQRPWVTFRSVELIVRTLAAVGLGMLVFTGLYAAIEYALVGRYVVLFGLLFGTAFVSASRIMLWRLAEQGSRKVLLYGHAALHARVASMVKGNNLPIRLVGAITLAELRRGHVAGNVVGELLDHCRGANVDEIVVGLPESLELDERRALSECMRVGLPVVELRLFFERVFLQVYVEGLYETWFWSYDPAHTHPWYFAFKRFCDISLSLAGLVASLPVAICVALAVKLNDRGPVLYSQSRLGLHNRLFTIYKFRTMRVGAESTGAQWAVPRDSRATSVGRWLRRTRLDEIPQFWNILRGDMSFIGPRPERPEFVEIIERELPYYSYRHLIKPGLSGWAQINYPYGASIEDARSKLSYDLYYLKYASVTLDLLIVFRTIAAMAKGAR